ncbi:MAG TPA: hypothetical protein VMR34_04570 [Candidatus Saccharimonadales bacterium]|nr:hypothetical protein [Candidatus Saccharimonadales bacterium]
MNTGKSPENGLVDVPFVKVGFQFDGPGAAEFLHMTEIHLPACLQSDRRDGEQDEFDLFIGDEEVDPDMPSGFAIVRFNPDVSRDLDRWMMEVVGTVFNCAAISRNQELMPVRVIAINGAGETAPVLSDLTEQAQMYWLNRLSEFV